MTSGTVHPALKTPRSSSSPSRGVQRRTVLNAPWLARAVKNWIECWHQQEYVEMKSSSPTSSPRSRVGTKPGVSSSPKQLIKRDELKGLHQQITLALSVTGYIARYSAILENSLSQLETMLSGLLQDVQGQKYYRSQTTTRSRKKSKRGRRRA